MLIFFDYLYYSVRKFYSGYKEKGPGLSAVAVITLTQSLNILTVYILYCLITETRVHINKLAFLALYLSVLILNVVRYSKLDPDIIKEKWENKRENQKILLRTFLFLYVVLSFVVCVGLGIYVGSKR
jgi:hypothetical protein